MLVRDLIALLRDMDPDAGVVLSFDGGCGGGRLTDDAIYHDPDDNTVVFDADCV